MHDETVKVYNFKVEDYHTYFVGDSSLLVHNAGPTYVLAQTQTNGRIVSGTVKDAAGEPVIGASVLLKGNTGGTIRDLDGRYS